MTASAALITGIALAVAEWPEHDLAQLESRGIPVIADFAHRRHTSRKASSRASTAFHRTHLRRIRIWRCGKRMTERRLSLRQIATSVATKVSPLDSEQ
jgi:hypothetical protein